MAVNIKKEMKHVTYLYRGRFKGICQLTMTLNQLLVYIAIHDMTSHVNTCNVIHCNLYAVH